MAVNLQQLQWIFLYANTAGREMVDLTQELWKVSNGVEGKSMSDVLSI